MSVGGSTLSGVGALSGVGVLSAVGFEGIVVPAHEPRLSIARITAKSETKLLDDLNILSLISSPIIKVGGY